VTRRPAWRRLARTEARLVGEAVAAGVDEAGRGPLAGPVVAAAVILDRAVRWEGIDDSKGIRLHPKVKVASQQVERVQRVAQRVRIDLLRR